MPLPVKLREIADEVDAPSDEWTAKINRTTGDVVAAGTDHWSLAEWESPADSAKRPEWERELLNDLRQSLESDDWLTLPGKFELHEYRVMESFCRSLTNDVVKDDLLRAIVGRGAFRRFKSIVDTNALRDEWFAFRDAQLLQMVREWLEENGIAFVE